MLIIKLSRGGVINLDFLVETRELTEPPGPLLVTLARGRSRRLAGPDADLVRSWTDFLDAGEPPGAEAPIVRPIHGPIRDRLAEAEGEPREGKET